MPAEKRKLSRRSFSYYMRVTDETNGKLIGHLADISTGGFKLDCSTSVSPNKDFRLRIELTSEVANKSHMIFLARSRWCRADPHDRTAFHVGFQITNMAPSDFEIFSRMFEKYGSQKTLAQRSSNDYLWR